MLNAAAENRSIDDKTAATMIDICFHYQSLLQLLKLAADGKYASDQFSHSFKLLLSAPNNHLSFEALENKLKADAKLVSTIFKRTINSDI